MTDKEQIIIDGVDVKNCRRRIGKNNYCRYFKRLCSENNFNCVWKQLARKTQECESLKQEIEILQNNYDTATRDCNEEIARLEQECEELEQTLTEIKEIASKVLLNTHDLEQFKDADALFGALLEIHKKISECEELKKELRKLELENTTLQNRNQQLDGSMTEVNRYRKALEEIEDFRKKHCDFLCEGNRILDIISNAKGENKNE